METSPFRTVRCARFQSGRTAAITDTVAREIAITVRLDDGPSRRLYASPLDLEALALGHAALELAAPGQVPEIRHATEHLFEMTGRRDPRPAPDPGLPRVQSASGLVGLMRRFIAAPGLWDNTGCFHRAALFDTAAGEFVALAEDIGRHNCLDRLAGQCLTKGLHPAELALFLSCRVTASMMDKAARAGVRLIVSRSAVTDAAIDTATRTGATLVGFAREAEERLTIFVDSGGRVRP